MRCMGMTKYLLLGATLLILAGCNATDSTVDNRPTNRDSSGRTADAARAYAASGGNINGRPLIATGANR